jgi:MFS family permease
MISYIGAPLCDRIGRRGILLPTLFGMGVCWIAMAIATAIVEKDGNNAAAGKAGIALYFIFSAVYCIGITPLQGVYAVEVFSYEQRAKGIALSNMFVNVVGLINQFAT